jgi:heme exporter protein A
MAHFAGDQLTCIRGERLVFKGLSFAIESGGAMVLTGPNGSGKSSLLRLMAGLSPAAAGTMTWNDMPIEDTEDAHRRIHYSGHADAVKPMLTVAENVSFWARMRSNDDGVDDRIAAALQAFAITSLSDIPGRFLSAGQKRRVTLARIAAIPADLWLLDEPTTALDRDAITCLDATIAAHRDQGGMVVISTHADLGLRDATILAIDDFATGSLRHEAA